MKKTITICGLIGGLISGGWFVLGEQVIKIDMSMNMRLLFGYASIILGLSIIFVAVKNYRDNYNNGVISFGKAFKIGLLITLIASTTYVVIWAIDYKWFIPDYFDKFKVSMLADLQAKGTSAIEIQKKMAKYDAQLPMYKNSIIGFLFPYVEIVPVGLLVSLIAALILKKKSTNADILTTQTN